MKKFALLTILAAVAGFAQQPKFETADVHVSRTSRFAVQSFGGVLHDGLYINRDTTMLQLIAAAYGVSEDGIGGGPGWLRSDLFDVIAKVPERTTAATANLMLQSLLTERFGLVVQNGTSPVQRYLLSVGKNGPKLKSAEPSGSPGCQPKNAAPAGPGPIDPASQPNIKVGCHNLTAAGIAQNLHQMAGGYLDHDVIDETKLEGMYDFDLDWTGRGALAAKGADGISIFDAVDKQLGLKLELKTVPMPSLVVAKVNRKPTGNPEGIGTALAVSAARFEVASIKLADPDARPFTGIIYTGGSQIRAGGTLPQLIAMALQVPPNVGADVVVGIPKSAESQKWDITAKVPSTGEGAPSMINGRLMPPPLSVALEMLRGLLVEEFELKTHTEAREVTVYALTSGGRTPKMTRAGESERSGCKPDPNAPKPATNVQVMLSCKNTDMSELAELLQQQANAYMDHPVVDGTGIEGGWDFLIGWTPKGLLQPQPPANQNQQVNPGGAAGSIGEPSDPSGISAFEAVERELGLKLVKQKISIPVTVVDHVDDKPLQ
jgi:uncharacterized protein (TIGR03435 family)